MVGIRFDTEQEYAPQYAATEQPLFIRWVLATGVVKDEKQAHYVLIGIAVAAVVLALFFFFGVGGVTHRPPPPNLGAMPGGPVR